MQKQARTNLPEAGSCVSSARRVLCSMAPAVALVLAQDLQVAGQAQAVVAADHAAAGRAEPALFLVAQESRQAVIPDRAEVFDHAHVVFRAITFVQVFQPLARVSVTLKAETKSPLA